MLRASDCVTVSLAKTFLTAKLDTSPLVIIFFASIYITIPLYRIFYMAEVEPKEERAAKMPDTQKKDCRALRLGRPEE